MLIEVSFVSSTFFLSTTNCVPLHYPTLSLESTPESKTLHLLLATPFSEIFGFQEEFEEHADKAKTLPESTTNENKLILYGLYKQATVGNVNTSRPGIFNMRDRAKWDAWKAVEGKPTDEAMNDYITKVKQLLEEAVASA